MKLVFITTNLHKVSEFQAILAPIIIEQHSQALTEIQSLHVEEVIKHKMLEANRLFKTPCLVEDTGLYLDLLEGFPGALTKFYIKAYGLEKITKLYGGAKAIAKTAIGYVDGGEAQIFIGTIQGTIATTPSKGNGFGWDSIFIPAETAPHTFADLTPTEKNKCSMRAQALEKLKTYLKKN